MKKSVIYIVMLFVLGILISYVGIIFNNSYAAPNPEEIVASGTSGTCTWEIKGNGELTVKPTTGEECTLNSTGNSSTNSPWYSDREKVTSAKFEGKVNAGESIKGLFYLHSNLKSVDISNLNTSSTTNMSYVFYGSSKLNNIILGNIDTSNVTTMQGMFSDCRALKALDLSDFDITNVGKNGLVNFYHNIGLSKIKIGSKFKDYATTDRNGTPFGRGMWRKEEDGKIYSAVNIALNNLTGTFVKESNVIDEMFPEYSVNYKITIDSSKLDESSIKTQNNKIVYNNYMFYVSNLKDITQADYEVNDYVEFIIKDAATKSDGSLYDVKVRIDNIKIFELDQIDTSSGVVHQILGIGTSLGHRSYTYNSIETTTNLSNKISTKYDTTFTIIDKNGNAVNGNYMFSAYDLDVSASRDAGSTTPGYGDYSEGINLISGYDKNTIKIYEGGYIVQKDLGDGVTRLYGIHSDENSELSEFIVKVNANNFKYTWTGSGCVTGVLSYYQPTFVEIEKKDGKDNILKGAVLELYNSNKELVESWTSTEERHKIFLNPGRYVVKEKEAPKGYEKAEEIEFYVDINDKIRVEGKEVEKIELIDRIKKYKYTVNHYDKITKELLETQTKEAEYGSEIKAEEEKKNIEKYVYVESDKEKIKIEETNNEINLYYEKPKQSVIIKYVDKISGEEIEESQTIKGEIGSKYKTEKKDIEGYKYIESSNNTEGEYKEEVIEVIYYYEKKKIYEIKTRVVNGEISGDVEVEEGGSTTVEYKAKSGYKIEKIKVDGKEIEVNKNKVSYKFSEVKDNHEIEVIYTKIINPQTLDPIIKYVSILVVTIVLIILMIIYYKKRN